MPATPSRIAFITKPSRNFIAGPDVDVEAAYGELARETDPDAPVETFFDSGDDAQAMADERLALLFPERGRYQAQLPDGLSFALALDYSQATPTGTVIDLERDTNKPALTGELGIDLRRGAASIMMWG